MESRGSRTLRDVRTPQVIMALLTAVMTASCAAPPPRVQSEAARNREQLLSELLDVVDAFSSRLDQAYMSEAVRKDSPRNLARLAVMRNGATANARAMVLGEDPGRGLVDLYIWSRVADAACRSRIRLYPDDFDDICDNTYGVLVMRTSELAEKWMPHDRRARIDSAVNSFLQKHPDLLSAGLFRLIDLEDRTGIDLGADDPVEDSMFASVTEATRELEATRITAQQMLWMLSRMPTSVGWEVQGQIDLTLTSDQVTNGLQSLDQLVQRLEAVQSRMDVLSKSVDGLGSAVGSLAEDLSGKGRVEGIVRRTLLLLGAVLVAVVAAATVGAMLVVRRWRAPRREASARS